MRDEIWLVLTGIEPAIEEQISLSRLFGYLTKVE
jgi:hypothetical protein